MTGTRETSRKPELSRLGAARPQALEVGAWAAAAIENARERYRVAQLRRQAGEIGSRAGAARLVDPRAQAGLVGSVAARALQNAGQLDRAARIGLQPRQGPADGGRVTACSHSAGNAAAAPNAVRGLPIPCACARARTRAGAARLTCAQIRRATWQARAIARQIPRMSNRLAEAQRRRTSAAPHTGIGATVARGNCSDNCEHAVRVVAAAGGLNEARARLQVHDVRSSSGRKRAQATGARPSANRAARMNVADLLTAHAHTRPDAAAVLDDSAERSFATLEHMVWACATWLRDQGVAPGDRTEVVTTDEQSQLVALLALMRIGATRCSLSPGAPRAVRIAEAERLGVRGVLSNGDIGGDLGLPVLRFDLQPFAHRNVVIDRRVRAERPAAPATVLLGSGTTGRPKCIALTHAVADARLLLARALGQAAGEANAVMAPLHFLTGAVQALRALAVGAPVVFYDRARESIIDLCVRRPVRVLHATVAHAQALVSETRGASGVAFPTLRMLRLGSSIASPSLLAEVERQLTPNVWVVYGTNESGGIAFADPQALRAAPGTVGWPCAPMEVQVLDEAGEPCPPGATGMIRVRGPSVIESYADDPAASAAVFRDGWFLPGDIGRFDEAGRLAVLGRADDMMIIDGVNIFP
ncbi:MAG: acyl--CoA ligase, partial [Burkholderiales bacterium]